MLLRQTKIWYILEKFIFNKYIETNYTGKICSNDNLLLKQVCLKCQKFIKRDIKTTLFSSFKNILKKGRQSGIDSFSIKIAFKKNYLRSNGDFSPIVITLKKYIKTMLISRPSKSRRKKYIITAGLFDQTNYLEESMLKQPWCFAHWTTPKKMWKWRRFFDHWNYV